MRSEPAPMPRHSRGSLHAALLAVVAAALVWSAVRPYEYGTWLLEVLPVLVAIPLLALTYRRYRLTDLTYVLIAVHAIILVVGGHYTYARVPLGDWFRDTFELSRNHYDRLGHFAQGFVPAIIAREVLLRSSPLRRGRWLAFLVVAVCLAISASYEILEWQSAVWGGEAAGDFLGMQGDVWDAQKDMLLALIGAIAALLTLSRLHDREMPV
jgi:putative membrane protein